MFAFFLKHFYFGFILTMVFCYQNCSDPLWEKIVAVIKKNLFMASNHFVSPNFFHKFLSVEKENFLLVQNSFFVSFALMKSLFSFSIAKIKKNLWKKLGITKFVVWWFDAKANCSKNSYGILFQKHNIKIHLFYRIFFLALKTISPNFITVLQTTKLVVENRQKVRFLKHLEDLW